MSEVEELKRKLKFALDQYQAALIHKQAVDEKYQEKQISCLSCDHLRAENAALKEEVERKKGPWDCYEETMTSVHNSIEKGDYERSVLWMKDFLHGFGGANEVLLSKMLEEITFLRSAIARKDEALRWYGDEENYEPIDPHSLTRYYPIFMDNGQRAREALNATATDVSSSSTPVD